MAENANASFIPKKTQKPVKRVRSTRRIYLLSYLSYVLFFGSLLAAVGIFFYSIQVKNSLEASREALVAQRDRFSSEEIERVRTAEKKLLIADQLLNELTAVSRIFTDLETSLAQNLYLTNFTYTYQPNQSSLVSISGKANEFGQLIYQRDVFNQSPIFASADVKSFDYSIGVELEEDEEGNVIGIALVDALLGQEEETITFSFEAKVNNGLIEYQPVGIAAGSQNTNQITSVRSGQNTEPAEGEGDGEETVTVDESETANDEIE